MVNNKRKPALSHGNIGALPVTRRVADASGGGCSLSLIRSRNFYKPAVRRHTHYRHHLTKPKKKMSQLRFIVVVSCLYVAQGTMVNPDIEMERFTTADSKSGRLATVYKPKDNIAAASRPSNIVYGKAKVSRPGAGAYIAPSLKGKPIVSKFKPSQEDAGYDADAFNSYGHGYKPTPQETAALQKYMQRYASQVLNAQKHSGYLSDAQKQVLANDPYKKFPTAPPKHKFVPIVAQEAKPSGGEKLKDHDTVEIVTEKYQAYTTIPVKTPKSPPKKVYSFDNTYQSSDFKYSNHDSQLASQLLAEPEKETWSSYEPYQYGIMTPEKSSELSKITGYKIPATSLNIGHHVESKDEESGDHHEEEHYAPHEPKYEYMYQVNDPEKHSNFGHSEARKGKTTWGRYYVQLPDGRLETVKYWVDKSGYHAEVDFKGEAKHPSHKEYVQHHEEPEKSYPKKEEIGLGGHSETSFSLTEAAEEY